MSNCKSLTKIGRTGTKRLTYKLLTDDP